MIAIEPSVLEHVVAGFHIPPKPEILSTIQAMTETEDVSPFQIGNVLAKDVGLSAAVLKTLNSPFYGMSRTVTDVKQAAMLLGVNSIKTLVASYEIKRALSGKACISLERFWDNAREVAELAAFIGKRVNPSFPIENLYALGLFHDCGLPAMAIRFPDYVSLLKHNDLDHEANLVELEEARYQCNHAVVGYYIASSWGLPKAMCEVILEHHAKTVFRDKHSQEFLWMYACLKTADNLVEESRRFKTSNAWPHIKDEVLSMMGMTDLDYSDLRDDYLELQEV